MWEYFLAQWVFALKFQHYGENVVQQVWNFDSQSPGGGNWERLWGRKGRFPCTYISTPKLSNCEVVDQINGVLLWSFRSMGKTWLHSLWAEERVLYGVWSVALDWFLSGERGFYPLWYQFGVLAWVVFV